MYLAYTGFGLATAVYLAVGLFASGASALAYARRRRTRNKKDD